VSTREGVAANERIDRIRARSHRFAPRRANSIDLVHFEFEDGSARINRPSSRRRRVARGVEGCES